MTIYILYIEGKAEYFYQTLQSAQDRQAQILAIWPESRIYIGSDTLQD